MEELISGKAAKVLDMLDQIEAVNEMISIHEGDPFMRDQYIYRKEQFIKDLVLQLREYKIEPDDLTA